MDNATEGFTKLEDFLAFLFAGKATFTLTSKATGAHYTYTVRQWRKRPEIFFVKTRGSDGEEMEVGSIARNGMHRGMRETTRNNATPDETRKVQTFRWLLDVMAEGRLPRNAVVQHDGRCGACNRPLTHPGSIRTGFGPECASKLGIVCERVAA